MEKVEIKKWDIEIEFELRKLRYELVNQTGPVQLLPLVYAKN